MKNPSRFADKAPATQADVDKLDILMSKDPSHLNNILDGVEMIPGSEVDRTLETIQTFINNLYIGALITVDNEPAVVLGGHVTSSIATLGVRFGDGQIEHIPRPEDHSLALAS